MWGTLAFTHAHACGNTVNLRYDFLHKRVHVATQLTCAMTQAHQSLAPQAAPRSCTGAPLSVAAGAPPCTALPRRLRRPCVSVSRRSRSTTYCLKRLTSQGMPAAGSGLGQDAHQDSHIE